MSVSEMSERLVHGAVIRASIEHPHLLPAKVGYDSAGQVRVVLQRSSAPTLTQILDEGPLSPRNAVVIAGFVAAAVDALGRGGLVARDLTPDHILVHRTKGPLLADGGIRAGSAPPMEGVVDPYLPFRPPEEVDGDGLDARSNVYSLGAVMLTAVTGAAPSERLRAALTSGEAAMPPELDAVIARAMEADPGRRYQDIMELRRAAGDAISAAGDAATIPLARPVEPAPARREAERAPEPATSPTNQRTLPKMLLWGRYAPIADPKQPRGAPHRRDDEAARPRAEAKPKRAGSDRRDAEAAEAAEAAERKRAEAERKRAEAAERKRAEAERKRAEAAERKRAEAAERKREEAERKQGEAERRRAEAAERKRVEAKRKRADAARKRAEAGRKRAEAAKRKRAQRGDATDEPKATSTRPQPARSARRRVPGHAVPPRTPAPRRGAERGRPRVADTTGPRAGGVAGAVAAIKENAVGRRRAILAAGGVMLAVGAAVVAITQGDPNDGSSRVTANGLSLTLPADWERAPVRNMRSVSFQGAIAAAPHGAKDVRLVVGFLRDGQDAQAALRRTGAASATPTRTRVGRLEAWRYREVHPAPGVVLSAYLVPTTAGPLLITCHATPAEASTRLPQCERIAATINLRAERPVSVRAVEARSDEIRASLEDLGRDYVDGRRALATATLAEDQMAAANSLEENYRDAAARLGQIDTPAGTARLETVSAILVQTADGYRTLAAAVASGDQMRYDEARATIIDRERAIRESVADIRLGLR